MKDSDDVNALIGFLKRNEYSRASALLRILLKNPLLDKAVFEAVHSLKEGTIPSAWDRIDWMFTVSYWKRWYAFLDEKEPDRRKPAYDRLYVDEACETIPHSFDYAVVLQCLSILVRNRMANEVLGDEAYGFLNR